MTARRFDRQRWLVDCKSLSGLTLFPQTALVGVILIGLALFSDFGIGPSIMPNKRGDAPALLNTAWTIQVLRGAGLSLGCCALARPAAVFYGEPQARSFPSDSYAWQSCMNWRKSRQGRCGRA